MAEVAVWSIGVGLDVMSVPVTGMVVGICRLAILLVVLAVPSCCAVVGVGTGRTGVPKADGGLFLISRRASRADAVSWAETEAKATVAGAGAAGATLGGGLCMCYFLTSEGTVCVLVDSMDSIRVLQFVWVRIIIAFMFVRPREMRDGPAQPELLRRRAEQQSSSFPDFPHRSVVDVASLVVSF